MADIINPTVAAFCNEVIRPYADRKVGLKASVDIEIARWFAVITGELAAYADDDVVMDNSHTDGRESLTKSDVTAVVVQMIADQTAMDVGGVMDVLVKAKVNTVMI